MWLHCGSFSQTQIRRSLDGRLIRFDEQYNGSARALWKFIHFLVVRKLKSLANEDTLLRTHCCPWCFLCCANWVTFVADTKCFWTKSETFFVSRTQSLCPQQVLRPRANGERFVPTTIYPQQCVLVYQGLKTFLVLCNNTCDFGVCLEVKRGRVPLKYWFLLSLI